jgi:CRISPR type III-B/RAMP module-associated protein Cmr3
MYRKWPEVNEEHEQRHVHRREKEKNFGTSRMRFGGLKTLGPFPAIGEEIYFPTPLDFLPGGCVLQPDGNCRGNNNLPAPLTKVLTSRAAPTKNKLGEWIGSESLKQYLKGNYDVETRRSSDFYVVETRPGIEIDSETSSTVKGQFFDTEYIRLLEKNGAQMLAFAELESKKFQQAKGVDLLDKFFEDKKHIPFVFGGQCGSAYLECKRNKTQSLTFDLLQGENTTWGNKVKWVLLSHALFKHGWLPGFVDKQTGQVHIRKGDTDRAENETRQQWRARINSLEVIQANLVAARVGKSIVYSGWKLDKDADHAGGKPKATRLLVPAGSVYYFETSGPEESKALAAALTGKTKSDELGEHGFGLGVCCPY